MCYIYKGCNNFTSKEFMNVIISQYKRIPKECLIYVSSKEIKDVISIFNSFFSQGNTENFETKFCLLVSALAYSERLNLVK